MGASQVDTKPVVPAPTSIVSGNAKAVNVNTPVTIITIPTNRTWYGNVNATANNTTATAGDAFCTISVAGSTATPAANTVVLTVGDTGATGTGGNGSTGNFYVSAGTSAATLVLTNSTATTFSGYASANGILL